MITHCLSHQHQDKMHSFPPSTYLAAAMWAAWMLALLLRHGYDLLWAPEAGILLNTLTGRKYPWNGAIMVSLAFILSLCRATKLWYVVHICTLTGAIARRICRPALLWRLLIGMATETMRFFRLNVPFELWEIIWHGRPLQTPQAFVDDTQRALREQPYGKVMHRSATRTFGGHAASTTPLAQANEDDGERCDDESDDDGVPYKVESDENDVISEVEGAVVENEDETDAVENDRTSSDQHGDGEGGDDRHNDEEEVVDAAPSISHSLSKRTSRRVKANATSKSGAGGANSSE